MDKLKGKTILIGKEPGQGRLLVAIEGGLAGATGAVGSVPNSVSRCRVADGVAHAKIKVDQNGNMVLTNEKQQNVTYVNGSQIMSKRITPANKVELGHERYEINLQSVLETARKLVAAKESMSAQKSGPQAQGAGQSTVTVDITHLEGVWRDYHDALKQLRENQKRINLIRSGCGIFTMCAMPCIFFLGPIGYLMTGIGVVGNVYSFVGLKNDNTSDEQERLTEDFQDNYVCPNPDCNKYLGNLTYRLLKKQYSMHCPYCKCEYTENKSPFDN